jgi:hypothetical protein
MNCLVCGAADVVERPALVTAFLASRIWDRSPFPARLESCKQCSFQFFVPRLTVLEQSKLYAGYRGVAYQQAREAHEPWYTASLNESLDSADSLNYRRQFVHAVLEKALAGYRVEKLLDFGGHRGELVAGLLPAATSYVYDVSGVTPIAGVESLSTPESCKALDFDLIVCSNVIEHVSDPGETLAEIASVAGPKSKVFLEVPEERPLGFWSILKRILQFGVLVVRRPRLALASMRPGMLVQMHEHVNCFSPTSLATLLEHNNWTIESSGAYDVSGMHVGPFRFAGSRMIWALAKAPISI